MSNGLSDSPIHDYIPALIFLILFIFILIVILVVYFTSSSTEKWAKEVFVDCTTATVGHTYILRLIKETPQAIHGLRLSSLKVVILDNGSRTIAEFNIDDQRLNSYSQLSDDQPLKSVVRCLLFTSRSLKDMDSVSLSIVGHPFRIYGIEIQEIDDPDANIATVGAVIKATKVSKELDTQNYVISVKRFRPLEETVFPSRLLNCYEYTLFCWMASSLIGLLSWVIQICFSKEHDYQEGGPKCGKPYNFLIVNALPTGLLASIVTAVWFALTITIYRYVIKYKLEQQYLWSSLWLRICQICIAATLIIGLTAAAVASYLVGSHEDHEKDSHNEDPISLWAIAFGTGFLAFFILWLPLLTVAANWFNFFTKTIDQKNDIEASKSTSKRESPQSPKEVTKREGKPDDKDLADESENYYKQLLRGGGKVKSISQYKGTKKGTPTETNKDKDKDRDPNTETDSMGDSYYQQLLQNQEKVTSVSQYDKKKSPKDNLK